MASKTQSVMNENTVDNEAIAPASPKSIISIYSTTPTESPLTDANSWVGYVCILHVFIL